MRVCVCVCVTCMFSLCGLQGLGGVVVKLSTAESHPVFRPRCNLDGKKEKCKHRLRLDGLDVTESLADALNETAGQISGQIVQSDDVGGKVHF